MNRDELLDGREEQRVIVAIPLEMADTAHLNGIAPQALLDALLYVVAEGIRVPGEWKSHRVREVIDLAVGHVLDREEGLV